jgi:hypothetical protein
VPEQFILAIVHVDDGEPQEPRYVRRPFEQEPEFAVTSANYRMDELLKKSEAPS